MMKELRLFLLLSIALFSYKISAQCNQSLSINSVDSECNSNGETMVMINVTVIFGNGNNSATISYNTGGGDITAIILEDDNGDIINQTFTFFVPTCNDFSITLTAWTNPSGSGSSCTDPPPITQEVLPVEFGPIKTSRTLNGVKIEWTTLSEVNNEFFEIQRKTSNGNFENIGRVMGAVNSNRELRYEFFDTPNASSTYYYRIKQVDLDGRFSFSKTIVFRYNLKKEITIYPNPTSERLFFYGVEEGKYHILDSEGRVLQYFEIGKNRKEVSVHDLEQGMYFIKDSDGLFTARFIKN